MDFTFFTKYLSISLIKNHEYKALTSQIIKLCKIIVTSYDIVIDTNKILTIKCYL